MTTGLWSSFCIFLLHCDVLFLKHITQYAFTDGNALFLFSALSLSVSPRVSLPTDEPPRFKTSSPSGGDSGFDRRKRTEKHHPHGSTTMQLLGLPFGLFWLFWSHSSAIGGKGRKLGSCMRLNYVEENELAFKRFHYFSRSSFANNFALFIYF